MTHHTLSRRIGAAVVALSLVFGGAACSDDDEDTDTPDTEENGVDLGDTAEDIGEEIDEGLDELDQELEEGVDELDEELDGDGAGDGG